MPDDVYKKLDTSSSFSEFLKTKTPMLCHGQAEWDLALDLAEEAGFKVGFMRISYRPSEARSAYVYYVGEFDEMHTGTRSRRAVDFQEVFARFFGCENQIEIDESCVLFA